MINTDRFGALRKLSRRTELRTGSFHILTVYGREAGYTALNAMCISE